MMAQDPAVEPCPAWVLRSTLRVFQPCFAISKAVAAPITPAPMMIASAVRVAVWAAARAMAFLP
jgi:hypothetical protein